jgi:thiosulfate dehydrogenase
MAPNRPDVFAQRLLLLSRVLGILVMLFVLIIATGGYWYVWGLPQVFSPMNEPLKPTPALPDSNFVEVWEAPGARRLARLAPVEKALIDYGRELITHTSDYLGPKGSVRAISNGMNCQNCHLQAGTQPWGNNYFAVQSVYPKFRERSGTVENQTKRVNDCLERSLNGKALDSSSHEMRAILAYFKWLGTDVPPGRVPRGTGIYPLAPLDRAAQPEKGRVVYEQKCQSCHQANGEGVVDTGGKHYVYPPLWGKHSYNNGAGLFRLSRFAGYVKLNMPLGSTYKNPQLTDQEAWDVAAFVNSQPRPQKDLSSDWPKIAAKPYDHPFGPYSDPFTEQQHKYGPYGPIKKWMKEH